MHPTFLRLPKELATGTPREHLPSPLSMLLYYLEFRFSKSGFEAFIWSSGEQLKLSTYEYSITLSIYPHLRHLYVSVRRKIWSDTWHCTSTVIASGYLAYPAYSYLPEYHICQRRAGDRYFSKTRGYSTLAADY